MKTNLKKLATLLVAFAMIFALAACGGSSTENPADTGSDTSTTPDTGNDPAETSDEVYHISWAHSSSTSDRLALATEKMAAELEEASNGRLIIDHYPASQLGAEREELEGILLGTIDCAVISGGPSASFAPSVYVTNTPYQITEREIGWKVYDGEFGKMLGKKTEEEAGWVFLGWGENGLRQFSNSKKTVKTPEDMKGLKIRTMENDIHMAIVNSLGASATPIAFSELYTALQQGTVDGQENGIALTYSMGFNEVVNHMTMLPHIYDAYLVLMSRQTYEKLPADLQALMLEYGQKYCEYEREFNKQNDEEYLQKMIDAGLECYYPTEEEAKLFADATVGVIDLIREKVGDELVDAYLKAVAEAKAK